MVLDPPAAHSVLGAAGVAVGSRGLQLCNRKNHPVVARREVEARQTPARGARRLGRGKRDRPSERESCTCRGRGADTGLRGCLQSSCGCWTVVDKERSRDVVFQTLRGAGSPAPMFGCGL